MMAFEKYTPQKGGRTKKQSRAKVSIWKTGEMKFSPGAVQKFGLDEYLFAELFFDPETQQMGIHPSNSREKGALKLKKSRGTITLRIDGLLRKAGITPGVTAERLLSRDAQTGMLIVKLKTMPRRPARRKAASK